MPNFINDFFENRGWLRIPQHNAQTNTLQVSGVDIINTAPKIYQLGGQPYPWEVPVGTVVKIDASCLSGAGARLHPIELVNDGIIWLPNGEQVLYSSYGNYTTPAATVTPPAIANTEKAFFSATKPTIPWQFIYLGMGIRIRSKSYKNDADTAASTFRIRFGTSTGDGNNNVVVQDFTAATASSEISFDNILRITALGDAGQAIFTVSGREKLYSTNTPANNYSGDKNTFFSTAAVNYVSLTHTINNTTGGAALLNFSVSLVP